MSGARNREGDYRAMLNPVAALAGLPGFMNAGLNAVPE
jgi:hypothetical protein